MFDELLEFEMQMEMCESQTICSPSRQYHLERDWWQRRMDNARAAARAEDAAEAAAAATATTAAPAAEPSSAPIERPLKFRKLLGSAGCIDVSNA